MIMTYADVVDRLIRYLGGSPSDSVLADCKEAAIAAMGTLATAHNWSYLYAYGRVNTHATYSTGTVTYDHDGGTGVLPRTLTLSGGIWPDWSADGIVRIGLGVYRVESRVNATTVTLEAESCPDGDLASPVYFSLTCDTFLLPADYTAQDSTYIPNNFSGLDYVHPREWFDRVGRRNQVGQPTVYTITGDHRYSGRLVLRVAPVPILAEPIDFLYRRSPRPLALFEETGTASSFVDDVGVIGTATSWTTAHVGSVFRLSSTDRPPTPATGTKPPALESVIAAWTDATHIGLADRAPATLVGRGFTISDPIDIEPGSMSNAYLRCAEMHLGMSRVLKDKPSARVQYVEALDRARSADSRCFTGRSPGGRVVLLSSRLAGQISSNVE
jgi:hypothetical protein